MINRARAELFPGEENVLRFACLLINYSQPLILQNSFHDFALKLRVRDLRRTEEMFYLMVHFRRLSRNIKADREALSFKFSKFISVKTNRNAMLLLVAGASMYFDKH